MRFALSVLLTIAAAVLVTAQKPDDVLATANGHTIRLRDLSEDMQKIVAEVPVRTAQLRSDLLAQLTNERVIDLEAKALGSTPKTLLDKVRAKVPDPSEAEIKAMYDANAAALADTKPEMARKRIIWTLRQNPEKKVLIDYFTNLAKKYNVAAGKDINAANLAPTDVVATISGKPVTYKEYEEHSRYQLYSARADVADAIADELDRVIFQTLLKDDAKAQSIDSSELLAREVTSKLKAYTDEEQANLQNDFARRLRAKYKVNILYKGIEPLVENVSAGESPATGPANAPVTVIMFSDFQCPACAAIHPILDTVMARYPGKIRFVTRYYPLTSIHENAWNAALAAAAARKQGKFFEYIDILYKNNEAEDEASLKKYAAQLGLNVQQFELDSKSDAAAAEVRRDMAYGDTLKLEGTPSIFINGVRIRALSAEAFTAAIDRALGKQ